MSEYRLELVVSLVLAVLTLAAYREVSFNDFIDYDDTVYVTQNDGVKAGLTADSLRWAWTTRHAGYWQPLTWMSLQLDAQLFGLNARGFHLTNLLWHTANVVLLFWVLRRMTGAVWRSALVAALFAVHPLHVESVTWVAERKDVLSTFFWLLTLLFYTGYVQKPSLLGLLPVLLVMTLGLMAKPMLVTLPFVLLLLDYWPLGRLSHQPSTLVPLLREKLSLFALSLVFAGITMVTQQGAGAVATLQELSLDRRLANALVGYMEYLRSTIWPSRLGLLYPYPLEPQPWTQIALAGVLLVAITTAVLWMGRRYPYLVTGWFWFVGTLIPVIGLVQAGEQARADRFVYIPNMGLYLMAAWGLGDLVERWRLGSAIWAPGILLVLGACVFLTSRQVGYWKDSFTLWNHTAQVVPRHYQAHYNLGVMRLHQDKEKEGIEHLEKALSYGLDTVEVRKILGTTLVKLRRYADAIVHLKAVLAHEKSPSPEIHNALGRALIQEGQPEDALTHFALALQIDPDNIAGHQNSAHLLLRKGDLKEVRKHGERLRQLAPKLAEGPNLLGMALVREKKWEEAIPHFREAVKLEPANALYRCNLAYALFEQGNRTEAVEEYAAATQLRRDWVDVAASIAWKLATHPSAAQRDGARAEEFARQACQATEFQHPMLLDVLAAACAEAEQYEEAVQWLEKALAMIPAANLKDMEAMKARLELYQKSQAYRETEKK